MTLTPRDRRILLILLPILILIGYWFLLLSPKRADLSDARDQQEQAEQQRDQLVAQAAQLERARSTFAADYASVVRLGKAIPETVDSPSLLVQLDRASRGTQIDFESVTFGERAAATVPAPPADPTAAQPAGNAAAGGTPAATAPGTAAESAGNATNQANESSAATNEAAGGTDTTTTAQEAPQAPAATQAPLDQVALTFNFRGTYFDLADFFHRLKRFVYVANDRIFVRGRLMTIDTLAFARNEVAVGDATATDAADGELTATVGATVYLSPKAQGGVTGGATPQGPAGTTTPTPAPAEGSQTSSVPLATAGTR